MRILMFIDTLGFGGGAERQFAGLCKMLHMRGYDVHVVAYYNDNGYEEELRILGITVHIEDFGKNRISKLKNARNTFQKINPDVVISYKDGPNFIACVLKAFGAKWKLIVSDRNTVQRLNGSLRIMYRLYRYADYIVPNSYSQGRFIEEHFQHLESRTRVITNFTDTDLFKPANDKRTNPKPVVLVVARIGHQKNVLTFMDAVTMLKDRIGETFKIEWYGKMTVGEMEYEELCRAKIVDNHLENVFEFHRPVKDVVSIYQSADIFCLPSLYEGFPNVICEAMACGLPVTVSDVCDNSNIICNGVNGFLFNPYSKEDICNMIYSLIGMKPEKRILFSRKSRDIAIAKFSKESFATKYIELLNISCS